MSGGKRRWRVYGVRTQVDYVAFDVTLASNDEDDAMRMAGRVIELADENEVDSLDIIESGFDWKSAEDMGPA